MHTCSFFHSKATKRGRRREHIKCGRCRQSINLRGYTEIEKLKQIVGKMHVHCDENLYSILENKYGTIALRYTDVAAAAVASANAVAAADDSAQAGGANRCTGGATQTCSEDEAMNIFHNDDDDDDVLEEVESNGDDDFDCTESQSPSDEIDYDLLGIETKYLPGEWWNNRPFDGAFEIGKQPSTDERKLLALCIRKRTMVLARESRFAWTQTGPKANYLGQFFFDYVLELSRLSSRIKNNVWVANINRNLFELHHGNQGLNRLIGNIKAQAPDPSLYVEMETLRNQYARNFPLRKYCFKLMLAEGQLVPELSLTHKRLEVLLWSMMKEMESFGAKLKEARIVKYQGHRIFGSFLTGNIANEIQQNVRKQFGENTIPLLLSLGIDGSPLNGLNSRELIPVTLRILNYERRFRVKCYRLWCYLKQLSFRTKEHGRTESARDSKRFASAIQLHCLLEQFAEMQRNGPFQIGGYQVFPVPVLFHLDAKERTTLLQMNQGYTHCTMCFGAHPFTNYEVSQPRTWNTARKIVSWSRPLYKDIDPQATISYAWSFHGAKIQAEILFKATGHHNHGRYEIHPTDSTVQFGQGGGMHRAAPPDVLHTVELGTAKKVFRTFAVDVAASPDITADDVANALDISSNCNARNKLSGNQRMFQLNRLIADIVPKQVGIFSGGKTGAAYIRDLHYILMALLLCRIGITVAGHIAKLSKDYAKDIGLIVVAHSMLKRREHTTAGIAELDNVLRKLFEVEKRRLGKTSLKTHYLAHFPGCIRDFGSAIEFDTVLHEHDHIETVKRVARCTRKGEQVGDSALKRSIELDKARDLCIHLHGRLGSTEMSADPGPGKQEGCTHQSIQKVLDAKLEAEVDWSRVSDRVDFPVTYNKAFVAQFSQGADIVEAIRAKSWSMSAKRKAKDCLVRDRFRNLFLLLYVEVHHKEDGPQELAICVALEMRNFELQSGEEHLHRYILCGSLPEKWSPVSIDSKDLLPVVGFEVEGTSLFLAYPVSGALFLQESFLSLEADLI